MASQFKNNDGDIALRRDVAGEFHVSTMRGWQAKWYIVGRRLHKMRLDIKKRESQHPGGAGVLFDIRRLVTWPPAKRHAPQG
jgi:hypothetical protein